MCDADDAHSRQPLIVTFVEVVVDQSADSRQVSALMKCLLK
jgi:hypothetical protein